MKKRSARVATRRFLLLFLLPALVLGASSSGEKARITFDKESWDFGKIKEGDIPSYVFVFRNSGDEPLVIRRVRTSCGCTAALVSDKTLEPGDKGELKVTFNSRGYEGNVAKYVYVESNDPDQPVKQLTISANVQVPPRPRIDLSRYSYEAGLVLAGEPIAARAAIKNLGERELRVSFSHRDAQVFMKGKEVASDLRIPAGQEVEVEIRIPARPKAGLAREYVLIKSNDPRRANLSLYVSAYVVTKDELKELFRKYKDIIDSR